MRDKKGITDLLMSIKEKVTLSTTRRFLKQVDKKRGTDFLPQFDKAYMANDEEKVRSVLDDCLILLGLKSCKF